MAQEVTDLPPLYARWVREFLGGDPPREGRATCRDCAMAPPADGARTTAAVYFSPTVKCCTYVPTLPNFLAGAVLADHQPENAHGRRSLLARIAAAEGVTPLGVARTPADEAVYQALAPTAFGTDDRLRCPHLTADQLCGLWRHRNAVCATWFCKHERGAVGEAFWDHVREWLRVLEQELAAWCLLDAGWPASGLAMLHPPQRASGADVRGLLSRPSTPAVWGSWEGREAAFYERCADRVAALSWSDVARLCGSTFAARGEVVREAFRRLISNDLPHTLVAAPMLVLERHEGSALVWTYRSSDPLCLAGDAQRVVERFDGRPTATVLERLREEDGLDVDLDLVRRLRDFQLLRDAGDT
jgi:hypothetical protein